MFAEHVAKSNILEFIEEETSEEGTHKLLVRVLDTKRWGKMVVDAFKLTSEQETFGLSIRKEYYWADDSVAFCWVILLWGDLDDAVDALSPMLAKAAGPPPPPSAIRVSAPAVQAAPVEPVLTLPPHSTEGPRPRLILSRTTKPDESGRKRVETVVKLPHRDAPTRNARLPKNKKLGAKGRGAFVEGISGDEGNPLESEG